MGQSITREPMLAPRPPKVTDSKLDGWLSSAFALPAEQQPAWPAPGQAAAAREMLRKLPPIALPGEADQLNDLLALVARGEMLLLHGGDCAETFAGNTAQHVEGTVTLLKQLGLTLSYGAPSPVVKFGRIAGQYAKPRSSAVDSAGLRCYYGDIVNAATPSADARVPDPYRMIEAYRQSVITMNLARALTGSVGLDLPELHRRIKNWLRDSRSKDRLADLLEEIERGLDFITACARPRRQAVTEVFSGHEALLLDYERGLIRTQRNRLYDMSAHFLWIGERTRQPDGAHIALAALLANPIGVKLGAGVTSEEAAYYVERLNPENVPGRLTLITRMGAERIRDLLPAVIEKVRATGKSVIWQCDPTHANTRHTLDGNKTREFDRVVDEVQGFFEVHRAMGTVPGGVHLELTGDDVTECVGGSTSNRPWN
ncbi:MAG: 3-deoxy-7-phosphoheptulonate synthase [Nocardioidaceae bacterium]